MTRAAILATRLCEQAVNVEGDGWLNAARYMREAAEALARSAAGQAPSEGTHDGSSLLIPQTQEGSAQPVAVERLRQALVNTTAQLERVLNMMGLKHDHWAEVTLYEGKDLLEALASAPPQQGEA